MTFILMQLLNSFSYGALLFTIASGFSLIFGLMKITNMTHVVFYMMGAYVGYWIHGITGSFLLALIGSCVITGVVGLIVFRGFLFKLHGNAMRQVLCCLGFLFFFDDMLLALFGGYPLRIPSPAPFDASIEIFGFMFPTYRLLLIALGVIIEVALELIVNKTKLGALIRSGVDDEETTRAMGININRLFVLVYVAGTVLAAGGGVLGGPILGMEPRMCFTLLPLALAIVIIGGRGDLRGTFFASMIIAMIDNFGKVLFPELSYFTIFLPMALILVFKPDGLFSKSDKKRRAKSV
mgnify:CR=1 FL=1